MSASTLSEMIGRKVALQPQGQHFKGLCPFHAERTPSFTVNDERGFFHCFGCGAHGGLQEFEAKMAERGAPSGGQ
jgi:DNA primase